MKDAAAKTMVSTKGHVILPTRSAKNSNGNREQSSMSKRRPTGCS